MVPFILKVLPKFGLCSNCSQKFDECSVAHARKIFATARMLGFLLKFPVVYGKTGKHASTHYQDYECFWKNASLLVDILSKLTVHGSVQGSRLTLPETFCL